jgi:hypothetical protein
LFSPGTVHALHSISSVFPPKSPGKGSRVPGSTFEVR